MVDLRLDDVSLQALRGHLQSVAGGLSAVREALHQVSGDAMGAPALAHAVVSFGQGWGHGLGQLRDHAVEGVDMLHQVVVAFGDADRELADGLHT